MALLLAFLGLLAMANWFILSMGKFIGSRIGIPLELSLEKLFSYIFYPFSFLMGIPLKDIPKVATLLGERTIVTELVSYQHLAKFIAHNELTNPRSIVITSYALCGFAHIASLAIFMGGISALVPQRAKDLARVGFRALSAATLACLMTGAVVGIFAQSSGSLDFEKLRENMVSYQIEARGIKDKRVLEVMRKVQRHQFVPLPLQHLAYGDTPLPIGQGQTISQPYIVALMTELLQLKGKEKVLEIGTGSGYQAAILAELAREIYTIEILPSLTKRAERLLMELGYKNIRIKIGDGYFGWPEFAPFDAIMVTCAPKEVPLALMEQLAEQGRMVIPLGDHYQELKLLVKVKDKIEQKSIIPVRFVPMMEKR